ncbi:MAG: MFS transporter, partial [Chloroflexi bacterium]
TAFLGFFFLGSLDLERVQGYGPMAIGLAFLPVAVVMALFSVRFSAQLIGRFGPTAVLVAGQAVALIALAAIAAGPAHSDYFVHLLVPMALLGLGGGLSFPALTMIAMADVSPEDAGLASGLLNTTGEVGGAFGLAVLATIAGGRTLDMVNQGADLTVALSDGYHLAWMVCAGLLVLTLAAVVVLLRGKTAEQNLAVEGPCVECEAAA